MRRGRTLVAAVLTLATLAARAVAYPQWTPVTQTEAGVFLLDEASIEVRSGLLTATELVEYAWPQYADGVRYSSQVNLRAYRCDDRSWDVLRVTRHAGAHGAGEVVLAGNYDPSQLSWIRATPDSVADHLLRRVCSLAKNGRVSESVGADGR